VRKNKQNLQKINHNKKYQAGEILIIKSLKQISHKLNKSKANNNQDNNISNNTHNHKISIKAHNTRVVIINNINKTINQEIIIKEDVEVQEVIIIKEDVEVQEVATLEEATINKLIISQRE